jgi:hypothetical protein
MPNCPTAGPTESLTLGEVLRAAWPDFARTHRLPAHHGKVLRALAACHTAALGGHQYECSHCGREYFVPHSCGNRHCPTCQRLHGAQWLEDQTDHLLPIPYFHVVFTLPHELNPLVQHNQAPLYSLLFASATATLLDFGRNNLQATLGITAVLHTWGQNLGDHYHLHCLVTGGGVSLDRTHWVARRPTWLFPSGRCPWSSAPSSVTDCSNSSTSTNSTSQGPPNLAEPLAWRRWLRRAGRRQWVVYTKPPFVGPQAVLAYLCRYTHRVAITNRRLEALDRAHGTVTFRYKDYAHGGTFRSMTLSLPEFVQRFCLHILPPRFVKIRHCGLLANRDRPARIAHARALLGQVAGRPEPAFPIQLDVPHAEPPPLVCPYCGHATLVLIQVIPRPRAPSAWDSS